MTTTRPPVLFIHGLWLHATAWTSWIERFDQAGYPAVAQGWPGEEATVEASRDRADAVANAGIDEIVEHHAAIIAGMGQAPILIGHSFGGMVAQKLLGQGRGAAAIAIDAAQIKGVLPVPASSLRAAFPVFRSPANRRRAVSLSAGQFRYAFGNALPEHESDELHERWTIPSPGRPLFEAAIANFSPRSPAKVDTGNADRGPLLLIMGGRDRIVPPSITKSTLKQYRRSPAVTDLMEFPDRGHSLTIDSGWREVADACLVWLDKHNL